MRINWKRILEVQTLSFTIALCNVLHIARISNGVALPLTLGFSSPFLMPPRRTLLDDDEDFPMAGAHAGPAIAAPGPIALDFGALQETLLQQLVRHWLNERHAPDILPVQAEVLGALLDHIRRQVRQLYLSIPGIVRK